jgi:peptidoglycan hydrolase CwlO-like protein
MAFGRVGFAFLAILHGAAAADSSAELAANPVRRVVSMLQMMSKKIAQEGEEEKKQFDRFMCYCETGGETLKKSIADAETKIPQLESEIKEKGAAVLQLKADLKAHKEDRAAANTAMKEATALREKEASAFAKYSSDATANLNAMTGAINALEKGMSGAFIQTPAATLLRKIAASADLEDDDRETVTAFLSQGYAPQSGQITGILKQMKDTLSDDLDKATKEESAAKASYEDLMKAKTKEVEALQHMIEEKTQRLGEFGVEVVNMADDLEDTKQSLAEDKKFLQDLDKNCATKKEEWAVREKLRAEEQLALADTIKILNDDDALELFKKTLPTPAFMQIKVATNAVQRRAQEALRAARGHDTRLDLISLALRGRKVNFDKVLSMIDDMVALLGQEQAADDQKKAYCAKEFDDADDEKKALERAISDLETNIDDQKSSIATLTEEIAALEKGIKDLDKEVAEATETRKEAHKSYVDSLAANKAADELLGIAKNRLNKFYNPKLYRPAPKRELSEEERITVNMGGTLAATAAPGGIAGTGVTVLAQHGDRPGPAPEMYGSYKKQGEESTGVIAMIDLLKADLAKEMQESETEEKNDQSDYEKMVEDSAAKRAADSKSLAEKQGVKADTEAALVASKSEKKSKTAEAMANAKYIHDLHQECDWLLSNFDVRKEARAGEVESLKTAKSVLSGADYSFVQTKRHKFLA